MEKVDHDLLLELTNTHYQLRKLYDEHIVLEEQLREFESRPAYSSAGRMKEAELKKRKLKGMDRIMSILNDHRAAA